MKEGSLISHEGWEGATIGLVISVDTDIDNEPIFEVLWDDGSISWQDCNDPYVSVLG